MKSEEFIADFILVSKRALTEYEYRVFKYHYLLGADWKLCSRKLNIDRGEFFHDLYRIQQKLGRTFRELQPYALFPVDEYFASGSTKPVEPSSDFKVESDNKTKVRSLLKYPLKRAA